jgi:pyruvate/2-oxoglutarate dehydrogenase complex dihydrolipoamide dehydrogenase (E3) component
MADPQHSNSLTYPPINTLQPFKEPNPALATDHTLLKNIAVIGAGYVGLSNAILLAQAHLQTIVTLFDIDL